MSAEPHPLARASLRTAMLPEPRVRYRPEVTERLFTNPFAEDHGRYPPPVTLALQERFARWVLAQLRCAGQEAPPLSSEQVLFTQGSIGAIDLLLRAFCEPRADAICIQSPTFPAYRQYASAYDIEVRDVALQGAGYDHLDVATAAATGAKLTFVCNPTSPVGSALRLEQIRELSARATGLVVVDEAYIEFCDLPSAAALIGERGNVVVLRTFSKAWGLAGLRVGAVLASSRVLHALRLLQEPYAFHSAAQAGVAARLESPEALQQQVALIRAERQRVERALQAVPVVTRVFPSHTNFVLAQVRDVPAAFERCLAAQLLVGDASKQVERALRISLHTPAENDRTLAVLRSLER